MGHSRPLFSLFSSLQQSKQYSIFILKFCRWLNLNLGPLVLEVTALPQPLPYNIFNFYLPIVVAKTTILEGFQREKIFIMWSNIGCFTNLDYPFKLAHVVCLILMKTIEEWTVILDWWLIDVIKSSCPNTSRGLAPSFFVIFCYEQRRSHHYFLSWLALIVFQS